MKLTFGQVEAILAEVNEIASDKRVAFGARLKHIQRQGLVAAGANPGRGKAATMTFGELMQMATAVELIRLGLPPQRAASIVKHNWGALRYSVYLSTFGDAEARELAEEKGMDPPAMHWVWLVRADALAELTMSGVSEFDDFEAVEAVAVEDLAKLYENLSYLNDASQRRTLLINGTALSRAVAHAVTFTFRIATHEAMRADINQEFDDLRETMRKLDEGMNAAKSELSLAERVELGRRMKDAMQADYSTNPPTPRGTVEKQAREMLARVSPSTADFLADRHCSLAVAGDEPCQFVLDDSGKDALHELVSFGAIEITFDQTDEGEIRDFSIEFTKVGEVAALFAAEQKERASVNS